MSAVETAVKKVQGLSEKRARALLGWLSEQEATSRRTRPSSTTTPGKRQARRAMRALMACVGDCRCREAD